MKLLSVIVPAHNMEAYLPRCLGSVVVAPELMARLEVLVVNDGSADGTSAVAHGFEAKYPGSFRVIDKANGHYGSCVNRALQEATGRFVKVLDADDAFETAAFAEMLSRLADVADDVDVVLTDFTEESEVTGTRQAVTMPFDDGESFRCADTVDRSVRMAMHAVCYRTELLRRIGYVQSEGIPYTDTEWIFLPMSAIRRGVCFRLPVYRYTVDRPGQTMSSEALARDRGVLERICMRLFALRASATEPQFCLRYLEHRLGSAVGFLAMTYALDVPLDETDAFWTRLAERLVEFPFLNAVIDEISIFSRTSFPFRYVRFCLRHPKACRLVLPFVRRYCRARRSR